MMTNEMLECFYYRDENGDSYSDLMEVSFKKSVYRTLVHSKKKR
jgi:hypothetical protein